MEEYITKSQESISGIYKSKQMSTDAATGGAANKSAASVEKAKTVLLMRPKYQIKKSAENGEKKIQDPKNVDAGTKFSAKSLRRSQASLDGGGGCHGVVP
jgi:hypothetical protein